MQFRIVHLLGFTLYVAAGLALGLPWPNTTLVTVPCGIGGVTGAAITGTRRGAVLGASGALLLAVALVIPFLLLLLLTGFIYPIPASEAPAPYRTAFIAVWFLYLLATGVVGGRIGSRFAAHWRSHPAHAGDRGDGRKVERAD